jgi:hypothetical protein
MRSALRQGLPLLQQVAFSTPPQGAQAEPVSLVPSGQVVAHLVLLAQP